MVVLRNPGILMEYIDGLALQDLALQTPGSAWSEICEQAVEVLQKVVNNDMMNEDVQPQNVLVAARFLR